MFLLTQLPFFISRGTLKPEASISMSDSMREFTGYITEMQDDAEIIDTNIPL